MNRPRVYFILGLAVLMFAFTSAGCLKPASTGSVEGWVYRNDGVALSYTVTDSATPPDGHSPVKGASVTVDGGSAVAYSNEAGHFLLTRVPTGTRVLTVAVPNFWATKLTVTVAKDGIAYLPGPRKPWGIYLYGVAPVELLSSLKEIIRDLQTVGSNENFYIVAQLARYGGTSGDQGAQRVIIGKGTEVEIRDLGDLDMGDKDNLKDFVDWAYLNYPADHRMLLTFSHGDGWRAGSITRDAAADRISRSILIDGQHGNRVDPDQFAQALIGKRFDVITLNQCGTGGIEWAYELKDVTDYIVVSEALGFAYDYEALMSRLNADPGNPLAAVKAMIDSLMTALRALRYPATASVVSTAGLPALASSLSSLADSMTARGETTTVVNDLAKTPDSVQVFSDMGTVTGRDGNVSYDSVDIYDLARVLAFADPGSGLSPETRSAAQDVMDKLTATVTYNVALPGTTSPIFGQPGYSVAKAKGLSVAWPYRTSASNSFDPASVSDGRYYLLGFARDTGWDTLLTQRGTVIR